MKQSSGTTYVFPVDELVQLFRPGKVEDAIDALFVYLVFLEAVPSAQGNLDYMYVAFELIEQVGPMVAANCATVVRQFLEMVTITETSPRNLVFMCPEGAQVVMHGE